MAAAGTTITDLEDIILIPVAAVPSTLVAASAAASFAAACHASFISSAAELRKSDAAHTRHILHTRNVLRLWSTMKFMLWSTISIRTVYLHKVHRELTHKDIPDNQVSMGTVSRSQGSMAMVSSHHKDSLASISNSQGFSSHSCKVSILQKVMHSSQALMDSQVMDSSQVPMDNQVNQVMEHHQAATNNHQEATNNLQLTTRRLNKLENEWLSIDN